MNTPPTNIPVNPPPAGNVITAGSPTLGSIVGSAGGAMLAARLHVSDPVNLGLIVTGVTAIVTALFHWLGVKLGAPQLG